MTLTKSQFIRGKQCVKSLWLQTHKEVVLSEPDRISEQTLAAGTELGIKAQALFGNGQDVSKMGCSNGDRTKITSDLISSGTKTIYEATFQHGGVLVMVDILHKGAEGWEIYEVKSGTTVKETHINDVTLQLMVLTNVGLTVSKACVIHLNKQYVRGGEESQNLHGLFVLEDVTEDARELQSSVLDEAQQIQAQLKESEEPEVEIGVHCRKPYPCPAIEYCWKTQRQIPEISVFDLFSTKKALDFYHQGIVSIDDLPPDYSGTELQQITISAHQSNAAVLDKEAIRAFLNDIKYPIYHLDFETYQPIIPEIEGTRPYQQIPFQYSLHIEDETGNLVHKEFLAECEGDPRKGFAQSLVENIPGEVTVLAYSDKFEKARLKELAKDFPEHSARLMQIHDCMMDLAYPFQKKHYYHPDLKGKYSIKAVLPHLVPAMQTAYGENELVQNGGDAMTVFPSLKDMNPADRDKHREALLRYCKLDTEAMVYVLRALRALV